MEGLDDESDFDVDALGTQDMELWENFMSMDYPDEDNDDEDFVPDPLEDRGDDDAEDDGPAQSGQLAGVDGRIAQNAGGAGDQCMGSASGNASAVGAANSTAAGSAKSTGQVPQVSSWRRDLAWGVQTREVAKLLREAACPLPSQHNHHKPDIVLPTVPQDDHLLAAMLEKVSDQLNRHFQLAMQLLAQARELEPPESRDMWLIVSHLEGKAALQGQEHEGNGHKDNAVIAQTKRCIQDLWVKRQQVRISQKMERDIQSRLRLAVTGPLRPRGRVRPRAASNAPGELSNRAAQKRRSREARATAAAEKATTIKTRRAMLDSEDTPAEHSPFEIPALAKDVFIDAKVKRALLDCFDSKDDPHMDYAKSGLSTACEAVATILDQQGCEVCDDMLFAVSATTATASAAARPSKPFNAFEDKLLYLGYKSLDKDWIKVRGSYLPTKTPAEIENRFKQLVLSDAPESELKLLHQSRLKEKKEREAWTEQEDSLLRGGVIKYGGNWQLIHQKLMPNKPEKVMAARWQKLMQGQKNARDQGKQASDADADAKAKQAVREVEQPLLFNPLLLCMNAQRMAEGQRQKLCAIENQMSRRGPERARRAAAAAARKQQWAERKGLLNLEDGKFSEDEIASSEDEARPAGAGECEAGEEFGEDEILSDGSEQGRGGAGIWYNQELLSGGGLEEGLDAGVFDEDELSDSDADGEEAEALAEAPADPGYSAVELNGVRPSPEAVSGAANARGHSCDSLADGGGKQQPEKEDDKSRAGGDQGGSSQDSRLLNLTDSLPDIFLGGDLSNLSNLGLSRLEGGLPYSMDAMDSNNRERERQEEGQGDAGDAAGDAAGAQSQAVSKGAPIFQVHWLACLLLPPLTQFLSRRCL
ncbi:unnamed protein product [Chrysoparadoxa australica]